MSEHQITSDSDLRDRVRAETNYEDAPDTLPKSTLDVLIQDAKLRVEAQTQSTAWYTDTGLGLALLGVTCIKAKAHVENYSIDTWDLGSTEIDVRDGNGRSIQMQEYEAMIADGLAQSTSASTSATFSVTNSFIGG